MYCDFEVDAVDTVSLKRPRRKGVFAGNDLVQFARDVARVDPEIDEGAERHIAADPVRGFDVKYPARHYSLPVTISEARNPAPNPLSIFTTLTPRLQEFSIASRAVSPPIEAP